MNAESLLAASFLVGAFDAFEVVDVVETRAPRRRQRDDLLPDLLVSVDIASFFPAWRASLVDPMTSLRAE